MTPPRGGYRDSFQPFDSPAKVPAASTSSVIQLKMQKLIDLGLSWALAPVQVQQNDDKLTFIDPNEKPYFDSVRPADDPFTSTWDSGSENIPKKSRKKGGKAKDKQGGFSDRGPAMPLDAEGTSGNESTGKSRRTVSFSGEDEIFPVEKVELPAVGEAPAALSSEPSTQQDRAYDVNQNAAGRPVGFGNTISEEDKKKPARRRRWRFPACCSSQTRGGRGQLSDDDD
jgi:hypothetical protein